VVAIRPAPPQRSERAVAFMMAGVQFVNILDFMMVNPLGPQFAEALAVKTSSLPLVVGSYTAAASVTGLLGALYLERFDRRTALFVTLLGLAAATACGGLAVGFKSLILSRVLAGLFGGPATSLAFAIVADGVAAERRGWAMGIVSGGFAIASVLGVPAGLLLANWGGWRMPFLGVAMLVLLAAALALRLLPPLRAHMTEVGREHSPLAAIVAILKKRVVLLSLGMTMVTMMSGFIIIPNFPAYLQFNLGYPGERLDLVYLVGGAASLVTARVVGPLVDRLGSTRVALVGTVLLVTIVSLIFLPGGQALPILVMSTVFFIAMSTRVVAYNTLTSKVPEPHERARFQSVMSAASHAAAAFASFLSARLLSELPDHRLVHIERVAYASISMAAAVPFVMLVVERAVVRRAAAD
jgi:predicted MFS family arabinose efflux permease